MTDRFREKHSILYPQLMRSRSTVRDGEDDKKQRKIGWLEKSVMKFLWGTGLLGVAVSLAMRTYSGFRSSGTPRGGSSKEERYDGIVKVEISRFFRSTILPH